MSLAKSPSALLIVAAASICLAGVTPASAQLGGLINKGKSKVRQLTGEKKAEKTIELANTPASGPQIVFSTSPIDAAQPANLATSFEAGNHIYGLIQVEKTWRELLGKGRKDATEVSVPIDLLIDGKKMEFQYITIKNADAIDSKVLSLEIAPEPGKMTSYKDPGFFYAEGKGNRRIGPDTYTYNLAQLAPGQHAIRFQVRSYGDIFSSGEFTITATDYGFYASLREKILAEAFAVATMPKARKTDTQLEATMAQAARERRLEGHPQAGHHRQRLVGLTVCRAVTRRSSRVIWTLPRPPRRTTGASSGASAPSTSTSDWTARSAPSN